MISPLKCYVGVEISRDGLVRSWMMFFSVGNKSLCLYFLSSILIYYNFAYKIEWNLLDILPSCPKTT